MAIIEKTIEELRTYSGTPAGTYYVTDKDQEGMWRYAGTTDTLTDNLGTILNTGWTGTPPLTPPSPSSSFPEHVFERVYDDSINVKWFGAIGDGNEANADINTDAFRAASSVINESDGGELLIPPGDYRVGRQHLRNDNDYPVPDGCPLPSIPLFAGDAVIFIIGCTRPVRILGVGATLKYIGGLYFGAFEITVDDPLTIEPYYSTPPPSAKCLIVCGGCKCKCIDPPESECECECGDCECNSPCVGEGCTYDCEGLACECESECECSECEECEKFECLPLSTSRGMRKGMRYQANIGNMMYLENNNNLEIIGLRIDGNIQNQQIGGEWGDQGYQCTHSGIWSIANLQFQVEDMYVSNFGLDGIYIGDDINLNMYPMTTIINTVSTNNGRQAMSITGGESISIVNSKFNNTGETGHAGWVAALGAGIDFESETGPIKHIEIIGCEFINNQKFGIIIAPLEPEISYIKIDSCIFSCQQVPKSKCFFGQVPNLVFTNCKFRGYVEASYTEEAVTLIDVIRNKEKLVRFSSCWFEDAMNNTEEQYLNSIFISNGCLVEDCTFVFTFPEESNPTRPEYLLRGYFSIFRSSSLIVKDPDIVLPTLVHFYESMIENFDIVIGDGDVAKGWYVEDYYQTNTENRIKLVQPVTRITPRPYWYNTWADNGILDKRLSSCIYVDGAYGSDDNNGFTEDYPVQSFDAALVRVQNQDKINPIRTILIKRGTTVSKDLSIKALINTDLLVSDYGSHTDAPKILYETDNLSNNGALTFRPNCKLTFSGVDISVDNYPVSPPPPSSVNAALFYFENTNVEVKFDSLTIDLQQYNMLFWGSGVLDVRFTTTCVNGPSSGDAGLGSPYIGSDEMTVDCIQNQSDLNGSVDTIKWGNANVIRDNF